MHPCTVTSLQISPVAAATTPQPPHAMTKDANRTGTLAVTLWYLAHGTPDDGDVQVDEGCVIHVRGERDTGDAASGRSRFDRLLRLESVADHHAACVSVLVEDLPLGSWRVTASRCSDHEHDAVSPGTASLPSSGWVASTSLLAPDAHACLP